MSALTFLLSAEVEFSRVVQAAFKNFNSLLELSRSPLAVPELIAPALILDEINPTADDRGRALRVVLRWAVNRLAPASPPYPSGSERPFDDSTWREPLWWRYNLLRHSYVEPLHPDLLDGVSVLDKLAELTGLPGMEALLNERSRAVRDVTLLLGEQIRKRAADAELRRMAVEDALQEAPRPACMLLELAATFRWVFPRSLLLEMAAAERLAGAEALLNYLVTHRLLLSGDGGASLLIPPALQVYLHARQAPAGLERRHARAARYYSAQSQPVRAAWHLHLGGHALEAANLLLIHADALLAEGLAAELREGLAGFQETHLPGEAWRRVQICLGDLHQRLGDRQQALQAYRCALKGSGSLAEQARVYRRLGKLYEDDNQMRALGYYHNAVQGLQPDDPEWLDLLKDRAWLHIIRREWEAAESDLMLALEKAPSAARRQRADIYHALAGLYRRQGLYDTAIPYAQQALNMREEMGDLQRAAESGSTLGLIYDEMGDHEQAIRAYQESLDTFARLGDREGMGSSYLNIGAALYCAGRYEQAGGAYQKSLEIFQALDLPRAVAQAYQNLAENEAALNHPEAALHYWNTGYLLSQEAGLLDQVEEFQALRQRTRLLEKAQLIDLPGPASPGLLPIESAALEIARQAGSVSARMLVDRGFSKPTATRHLSELAQRGLLVRGGKGRSSNYTLPENSGLHTTGLSQK